MKIIYFTKYSRKGASSRLRSYQYFPYLEKKGFKITVSPLFGDKYLENLYTKKSNYLEVVKSYVRRFWNLRKLFSHDKVVIEKELFPYFPALIEFLLGCTKKKYIVDYDDAIFHNYDMSRNKLIHFFLKNKISEVMKYSRVVIVGNNYLQNKAVHSGATKVVIIPTVVDIDRYYLKESSENKQVTIGWIGSGTTFKYLLPLRSVLAKLIKKYDIKVKIVGCDDSLDLGSAESHVKWTEETEVNSILSFDIGIMPLNETPWELGKCAYKLIQYMACGLPVVATDVGANRDVVTPDCGKLVISEKQWFEVLAQYIESSTLRVSNGINGREMVESKFCIQQTYLTLIKAIKI